MLNNRPYNKDAAQCLYKRLDYCNKENSIRFPLLLKHINDCKRLVDIGCGWGQFLKMAQTYVDELWGVDENPDCIKDVHQLCPGASIVICRADNIALPDQYFNVAVTSQMLHEVELFGSAFEVKKALSEIHRILVHNGRYLLLDHLDPGPGDVTISLPEEKIQQLAEFERKFRYYSACHKVINEQELKISRRCLQDFLTKIWSLNSPMESMEMDETHNVFSKKKIINLIESSGFSVIKWITFSDIIDDIKRVHGTLLNGKPWYRKFLLVAEKNKK